jgi:hypothetical protein
MIDGGASCPPSLYELFSLVTLARKQFLVVIYRLDDVDKERQELHVGLGILAGERRLTPVSVIIDQLLCFA